ncbi:hypothetical protein AAHC03_09965 [Spirometra sp. Aus1]
MKKKKEALSAFIRSWVLRYESRPEKKNAVAAGLGSFYPVLRLLLPSSDYSRPAYGIGQPTMAKICVKAFGLAPKGLSAQTLLHFNNPKYSGNKDCRDLADSALSVLADHCEVESDLTISELHEQLDNIAYASNQEEKQAILTPFIRSISALELKWFVRIVSLRELHLGLSTKTVLTCFHPAAPSIWNVTQDLCTLCQRIADIDPTQPVDTKSSLSTAGQSVNLNVAYRPMLCSRANSTLEICIAYEKLFSGIADYCLCLEAKYDGERVQLHKSGDKYRYWSRSGREWSSSYGTEGNGTTGTLTPRLHAGGFSNEVLECVLDGEMFGFDTYTDTFVTKATGFDVKRPDATDGSNLFASKVELAHTSRKAAIVPCYVVFDILYLNGELLTHLPLRQRKEILLSIFPTTAVSSDISAKVASCYEKPEAGREIPRDQLFSLFPIVKGALYLGGFTFITPDKDRISRLFDAWVSNGSEGLVAKATTAPYVPAGRLHCGWWKLKPDYVLGLTTDLDCLIVGAYFGVGGGGLSNNSYFLQFLCAVRDFKTVVSGKSVDADFPSFLTFCRVSNGFTREQLTLLNKHLRPHWKNYDRRKINCGETEWLKVTAERPDVWIPPRYSVILQIHAAELTSSASYAAGYTLRFPRVAAIREDKDWEGCATVEEIESLSDRTAGKLTEKRLFQTDEIDNSASESETDGTPNTNSLLDPLGGEDFAALDAFASASTGGALAGRKRKRKEGTKGSCSAVSTLRVTAQYRSALQDPNQIVAESASFKDREFCLMLSSDFNATQGAYTKADLERAILKASGRIVQNPGAKTTYVIANRPTAKVLNLVESTLSQTAKGAEGGYDILTTDWLISSIQEGKPLPPRREHVWAVRSSTKAVIDRNYDSFGDSFTDPFSVESLRSFVSRSEREPASSNSSCQIAPVPLLPRHDLLKLLDSFNLSHDPLISSPLLACTVLLIEVQSPSKSAIQDLGWKMLRADLLLLGAVVFGPLSAHDLTPEKITGSAFPTCQISAKKQMENITHVVWLGAGTTAGAVGKFQKDQVGAAIAKTMEQTIRPLQHVSEGWARECVRERSWCTEIGFAL